MAAETRTEIDDLRRQIPGVADVAGRFDERLAALQKDVPAFESTPWVKRDRREDVIGRRAVALQNALKTLKDEVWLERTQRTFDQKQWWADANRQTVADSAAVNDYWKAWRGKLPVDAARLPMDVRQFMAIKSRRRAQEAPGRARQDLPGPPDAGGPVRRHRPPQARGDARRDPADVALARRCSQRRIPSAGAGGSGGGIHGLVQRRAGVP